MSKKQPEVTPYETAGEQRELLCLGAQK